MDGWMDGWMDGEVLIIGKVVGWSGGVLKSLVSCDFPRVPVRCIAFFFRVFVFEKDFFSIVFYFLWILGGFGEPKWRPKSIFGSFFFDFFWDCVLASILGGFLEARNLKNHEKQLFFQWFLLIFRKLAVSKKTALQRTATYRKLQQGKPFGTPPDHPTIIPMISTS